MALTSKKLAASTAVAGLLMAGAAVASAATAAADPPPAAPGDPAAPAPPPDPGPPPTALGTMGAVWGQSTPSPSGFDLLLSQNPVPAVPGSQPAAPNFGVLNTPQYLFGPNMKLDQQGQQSMYSAGPTDLNAPGPSGRIDAIQRAHGLWHMGIGQMPQDQLGEPLPGTAPPPGTNIPQGLGPDAPDQPPGPLPVPAPPAPGG